MSLLGNVFRSAFAGRNDKPAADPAAGELLAAELRALAERLAAIERQLGNPDAALAQGQGGATEPGRGR